jgi:hypothetical protein
MRRFTPEEIRQSLKQTLERHKRLDDEAWEEIERKMNMAPDTVKGIQHIEVKKADLVADLEKNRAGHRAQYEEAHAGYRKALLETVAKMYDDAKKGLDVQHFIHLDIPEDHTKDYDRVIGMMKMSIDDTVIITSSEYSQYVMDDWGWKEKFVGTANGYKNR